MAKRITRAEADNIRSLSAAGRSIREIHKMTGRSPRSIQRVLKEDPAASRQQELLPGGKPALPDLRRPQDDGTMEALFDTVRAMVPPDDLDEDRIKGARAIADVLEAQARSSAGLLLRLVKEGRYADIAACAELCRQLLSTHAAEIQRIIEDPDWVAEICELKTAHAKKVCSKLLPLVQDHLAEEIRLLSGRRDEFMASLKAAEDARNRGGSTVRGARKG